MTDRVTALIVFVLGLIFGSFFNVCIYRIPRGESIVYPPSHCTNCGRNLRGIDLIPVLSYLLIKGRCRYCKTKISPRYMFVELVTALIFTSIFLVHGISFSTMKYLVLSGFMIITGMIDYDTGDVYFKVSLAGMAAGVIFAAAAFYKGEEAMTYIYGAFLGFGIISVIILLTKGMGWGDAEICGLGGLFLGIPKTFVMLFFSFVLGGMASAILLSTGKKSREESIPFGPFIAAASVIAALFGDEFINWYWG